MNSVLVIGFGHALVFEVPKETTQRKIMNLACKALNTTGEDISTIIVFDGKLPKIKSTARYFID